MSDGEKVTADLLELTKQIDHAHYIEQLMERENNPPRNKEFMIPDEEQYNLIS